VRSSQPLAGHDMTSSQHVYGNSTRKDKRGVDLISDPLPFSRLWYEQSSDFAETELGIEPNGSR
jgi:hypothetical protein